MANQLFENAATHGISLQHCPSIYLCAFKNKTIWSKSRLPPSVMSLNGILEKSDAIGSSHVLHSLAVWPNNKKGMMLVIIECCWFCTTVHRTTQQFKTNL